MQKHKDKFIDKNYINTIADIQSCIRFKDLEEIGDNSHLLLFHMIGFFSFREWTLEQTINFFLEWLNQIKIDIDYFTIHPDKPDWQTLVDKPFKFVRGS